MQENVIIFYICLKFIVAFLFPLPLARNNGILKAISESGTEMCLCFGSFFPLLKDQDQQFYKRLHLASYKVLISESWFNEVREKAVFSSRLLLQSWQKEQILIHEKDTEDRQRKQSWTATGYSAFFIYLLVLSATGVSGKRGIDLG